MDLDVLFVGTAGAAPSSRRGLPATVVRRGGERLLFDCGEGTQRQLMRSIGLVDFEEVFLTHFHADHVLGLPGMLKSFALRQRERPLTIYGPPGLGSFWRLLDPIVGRLPFPVTLVSLAPNDELERDGYRLAAYEVDHRGLALGYALVESPRPGVFDPDRARSLGVTPGPDFGRLQRGETVNGVRPDQVMGEPRRGRKLVLAGDTVPCEMTRLVAYEADLLVHEATLLEDEAERARETRHSTARGAAELAAAARVHDARAHARVASLRRPRAEGGGPPRVREHGRAARLRPHRAPVPRARRAGAREGVGAATGAGGGRRARPGAVAKGSRSAHRRHRPARLDVAQQLLGAVRAPAARADQVAGQLADPGQAVAGLVAPGAVVAEEESVGGLPDERALGRREASGPSSLTVRINRPYACARSEVTLGPG